MDFKTPELKSLEDYRPTCVSIPLFIKSIQNIPFKAAFVGAPGCGKTTAARVLAAKLLNIPKNDWFKFINKNLNHENYIEINVAEKNKTEDVKDLIEEIIIKLENRVDDLPIVYNLEEAHYYTTQSKSSFLTLFQREDDLFRNVYFFLTTSNYEQLVEISKLGNALSRRLDKIEFKSLSDKQSLKYIKELIELNDIEIQNDIIDTIILNSNGSPGVINNLVRSFMLGQSLDSIKDINIKNADLLNFIIESSDKLNIENGKIDINRMKKIIDGLIEKNDKSWEKLRVNFTWFVFYDFKENNKMDYYQTKIFSNFLKILKMPIIDTSIGSFDFYQRILEMITIRSKLIYDEKD